MLQSIIYSLLYEFSLFFKSGNDNHDLELRTGGVGEGVSLESWGVEGELGA